MYNRATRNIVLSALFIALGIIIPILFHAVGMGSVFLPMHIPVILAGFFSTRYILYAWGHSHQS